MSFGFGVGDFLAALELASKVRDRWADAPKEYKSIKDETKNVENILRDIGKLSDRVDLDEQHETDLELACQSCLEVLEECKSLVDKYSSIQNNNAGSRLKVRRAWTRLQVSPGEIQLLRQRLSAQTTQLGLLYDAIETDLLIDVQEGVEDLQVSDAQRKRVEVANWFHPPDFADQQMDQLSRRQNGTLGWFLDHPDYQHWCEQANSVLLCPGIPGSGKSVAVATAIHDLHARYQSSDDVVIAYLYCNFNRQADQDLRSMLASLTRQLFQEKAQLPLVVTEIYDRHRDKATQPLLDELKQVLRLLVSSYSQVFILVDALDECGNTECQRDHLLEELFYLQKQQGNQVNVLATTRFIPEITLQFSKSPRVEIRADESDIRLMLTERMSRLARFVSRDIQLQEQIKTQLIDTADGMFLLARLQIDSLRDKTNPGRMKDALARLGKGQDALDGEYDKAIQRITLQLPGWLDLARKTLLWITYANRELSIDELREAIAIDTDRKNDKLQDYLDDEDQIVSVCQGLVEVDEGSRVVRLVHYTTQVYFEKNRDRWLPDGHRKILESCLWYLKMDVFAHAQQPWQVDLSSILKEHKLLHYAGKNWGVHAQKVQSRELKAEIVEFLSDEDYFRFSAMVTMCTGILCFNRISGISALHISSHFGLQEVLSEFIQRGEDINLVNSDSYTPLSCAATEGQLEVVRYLIAQPNINLNECAPLTHAVRNSHLDTFKLLLAQTGIDINTSRHEYGGGLNGAPPLLVATKFRRIEFVQLLLARPEINVNVQGPDGLTSLAIAVREESADIIQLLLTKAGIDPTIGKDNDSALSIAIETQQSETIRKFLELPGIDLDAGETGDGAWLCQAVRTSRPEIVGLLLGQPRINVNRQGRYKYTPLHEALLLGGTDILKMLLSRHDINVNIRDKYGQTPISSAAEGEDMNSFKLLLAHPGIDVNITDRSNRTPLHFAVRRRRADMVRLLLSKPDIKFDARSVLSQAKATPNTEIGRLILAHSDAGHSRDSEVLTETEQDMQTPGVESKPAIDTGGLTCEQQHKVQDSGLS